MLRGWYIQPCKLQYCHIKTVNETEKSDLHLFMCSLFPRKCFRELCSFVLRQLCSYCKFLLMWGFSVCKQAKIPLWATKLIHAYIIQAIQPRLSTVFCFRNCFVLTCIVKSQWSFYRQSESAVEIKITWQTCCIYPKYSTPNAFQYF